VLVGEWVEIRNAPDTVNNGLYRVQAVTTPTQNVTLDKVSGSDPVNATDTTDTIEMFTSTLATISDMAFTADSAPNVQITGTGLPTMVVGERFTVSGRASHNGSYEVVTVNGASDYLVKSLTGATTTSGGSSGDIRTTIKNLMWDTAGLGAYLLEDATTEDGTLDQDGVLGQAFYSKAVIDWKDDSFLIANAPFPMLTIDSDAGKYLIGQDPSGNNNGWEIVDVTGESIRSTKMVRNMGWSEISAAGDLILQYAGVRIRRTREDVG
jgi:hypothetical protein